MKSFKCKDISQYIFVIKRDSNSMS